MAREVKNAVSEMLEELRWQEDEAKKYVEDCKRDGRLQEDVWDRDSRMDAKLMEQWWKAYGSSHDCRFRYGRLVQLKRSETKRYYAACVRSEFHPRMLVRDFFALQVGYRRLTLHTSHFTLFFFASSKSTSDATM